MSADAVLSLTPRELVIMMRAQSHRIADEYEKQSHFALMQRQANNAKRVKASDLYKHPYKQPATRVQSLREKAQADNEWLSRLVSAGRKE